MSSFVANFWKRYRRRIFVLGTVVGGAYLLKRYATRKFLEWQEREANELFKRTTKLQLFESTERTANTTVLNLLSDLYSQISKILDIDSLTLLLKSGAPNKLELWEDLKVLAFSRAVAYIYGTALLVGMLRIKMNILGAYLYRDSSSDAPKLSPELQNSYLSSCNYLLNTGIEKLCNIVRVNAKTCVQNMSLTSIVGLFDMERVLTEICVAVETEVHGSGSWAQFWESPKGTDSNNDTMNRMLADTKELMEAGEFQVLISSCRVIGCSDILDRLAEEMPSNLVARTNNDNFSNPNNFTTPNVKIALAKLIPLLNKASCANTKRASLAMKLVRCEKVRIFSANIYEAFTCEP